MDLKKISGNIEIKTVIVEIYDMILNSYRYCKKEKKLSKRKWKKNLRYCPPLLLILHDEKMCEFDVERICLK